MHADPADLSSILAGTCTLSAIRMQHCHMHMANVLIYNPP